MTSRHAALAAQCRLPTGGAFLKDRDPSGRMGLDKQAAENLLRDGAERLEHLHDQLYAQRTRSVLLVLQGMDAAGKDGAIKRLAVGLNPQGLRVTSFAAPNSEERSHGFLWRIMRALPPRGHVGVFNRSHYEDVLAPRVDPAVAANLGLPDALVTPGMWDERLADIRAFEGYLQRQGCAVAKVFLHLSREEQRKRLLARLDDPDKAWKFDPADNTARSRWDEYQRAYEAAFAATATDDAPWHVVPADSKPVARALVQAVLVATLERLDLRTPPPPPERAAQMAGARAALQA